MLLFSNHNWGALRCFLFLFLLGSLSPSYFCFANSDEMSTSTIRHQIRMSQAVSAIMAINPTIRKNYVHNNLKYRSGDSAQVLRLLWWVRETESELRKEILIQWLLDKKVPTDKGKAIQELKILVSRYKESSVSMRIIEFDEIYSSIENERANRVSIKKTSGPSGIPILDNISESILLNEDANKRKIVYKDLPYPELYEGGDEKSGILYILIWLVEADPTIRSSILLPRIEASYVLHKHEKELRTKRIEPLLSDLNSSEKEKKLLEIRSINLGINPHSFEEEQ